MPKRVKRESNVSSRVESDEEEEKVVVPKKEKAVTFASSSSSSSSAAGGTSTETETPDLSQLVEDGVEEEDDVDEAIAASQVTGDALNNDDTIDHVLDRVEQLVPDSKKKKSAVKRSADAMDAPPSPSVAASQAVLKKLEEEEKAAGGAPGTVSEVYLENFMCHERMQLQLDGGVNFIVGQNGSGKSAIMVALTIGLGGSSSFTQRGGGSLKTFVKAGCTHAVIRIRLRNAGPDAYQPDKYGKSILISRKLNVNGGSVYSVRNAEGHMVDRGAQQVRNICEAFNLQINNPCAILMQETSREFLTNQSSQKKYEFFLKATQLEQMRKDYHATDMSTNTIKSIVARKQKMLPDMEKRVANCQMELDRAMQLSHLQDDIDRLENEYVWSIYEQEQAKLAHLERKVKKLESTRDRKEEDLVSAQRDRDVSNERIRELGEQVERVNAALEEKEVEVRALSMKKAAASDDVRDAEVAKRRAEKEVEDAKTKLRRVTTHIAKKEDELDTLLNTGEARNASKMAKAKAELTAAEKNLASIRERLGVANEEYSRLYVDVEPAEAAMEDVKYQVRDAAEEVKKVESLLRQVSGSGASVLHRLHQNMPRAVATLRSAKFQRDHFGGSPVPLPAGPLADVLKVRDPKWAQAIESCLNRDLNSFVVGTRQQASATLGVLRSAKLPNNVSVNVQPVVDRVLPMNPHDLPPARYTTMLQQLVTDQPIVTNVLIDLSNVERICLCEDSAQAIPMAKSSNKIHSVYDIRGGRHFVKGAAENYAPPNSDQARFIGVDQGQRVAQLQAELAAAKERHTAANMAFADANARLAAANDAIRACKHERTSLQGAERKAVRSVEDAESRVEDAAGEGTEEQQRMQADIAELKARRQSIEESIRHAEARVVDAEARVVECRRALDAISHELEDGEQGDLHREVRELDQEGQRYRKELSRAHKEATTNIALVSSLMKTLAEDVKPRLATLTAEMHEAQASVDASGTIAREMSPDRPEHVGKDPEKIMRESQLKAKALQEAQEGLKSREQCEEDLANARTALARSQSQLNRCMALEEKVSHMLHDRVLRAKMFRKSIVRRTKERFAVFLSQQGHTGSMKFDDERATLDIDVKLSGSSARDTRTLSGGERMFSTVAMLLALWESVEVPVRALDEFDVFMDSVNRTISINLLLDAAKTFNRQFIFITPHAISVVPKNVRVIKMRPPERGQARMDQFLEDA
jgi:chromosome segregation ATPase